MKYLWFTLLLLAQATMATAQEKETLYKTLDSLIANYDHQTAENHRIHASGRCIGTCRFPAADIL